jgi:hypothetical protein
LDEAPGIVEFDREGSDCDAGACGKVTGGDMTGAWNAVDIEGNPTLS